MFKARFQRRRKESTTSCSTCFEDLDAVTEDITFCDKCGQNFHEACIAKWMTERRRTFQPMTCPTCRGNRTDRSRPDIERFRIEQELDGQAVQVYLDWLYSGTLHIDASVSRTEDYFNVVLLQCWEVSDAMDDEGFRDAVIQEFFNEAEAHFWARSIDYAFVDGKGSDAMRDFVMDIFLTQVSYDWFKTEGRKWPKTFVQKLADHCMKKALSGERIKSYEEIEAVYVTLEEDEDKDAWMKRVSADEDDIEDLPLSVLSRSIAHSRISLHRYKENSRTDRQGNVQSERPSLHEGLRSRPFSPSSGLAAGGSGFRNILGELAPQDAVLARRGRPVSQAGFVSLHECPVRPTSFNGLPHSWQDHLHGA